MRFLRAFLILILSGTAALLQAAPPRGQAGAPEPSRLRTETEKPRSAARAVAPPATARLQPDPLLTDKPALVVDRLMPSGVRVIWTWSTSESELRIP